MKQFWQRLGFRKIDEMEQYIIFKAQRNAYLFLVVALLIWSLYESCQVFIYHSRLNLIPGFLLTAAVLIQSFSQLMMTRSFVKDDSDSFEREPLIKIIILVCGVIGIAATITAAIMFLGVGL